jgi:REP element-mobilizing transposase RayT
MPQSLSYLLVYIVFSTKERTPLLNAQIRPDLYAYLATVARNQGCECYRVGGTDDHMHLAVRLSRTLTSAKLVEELKTQSSKWLKMQSPSLAAFAWQAGYGVFSLGASGQEALLRYIDGQEEHHKKRSFQDEYRALLKEYGVEFDEQYVWG